MKFQNILTIIIGFAFFTSCTNDKTKDVIIGSAKTEAQNLSIATVYKIKPNDCKVNWTGSKPTGKHMGYINASSGELSVRNNTIKSGTIILDMNSITCTDLEGDAKTNIEAHLKGTTEDGKDDFFDVTKFPTSTFTITKITEIKNDPNNNSLVYGNFTLKNITKEIGFKANINIDTSGLQVKTSDFSINRTDWGIKFMSKNFIEGLKNKYINDAIVLSIELDIRN